MWKDEFVRKEKDCKERRIESVVELERKKVDRMNTRNQRHMVDATM